MPLDHVASPPDANDPRFMVDVAWLTRAAPLIHPAYWQAHGLGAASCDGWLIPPAGKDQDQPYGTSSQRLGHHFERVHEYLLRAQPGATVFAMNLPIKAAGVTLGELDCLWADANGAVIHREVAVKYYLAFRESDAAVDWVGPGKADRLDKKLDRFTQHQARLPALAAAHNAWPWQLPQPVRSEVLMMGALFRHLDHEAWPHVMNPEAEGGFWCTVSEFVQLAGSSVAWLRLPKPWWLSPQHRAGVPQTAIDVASVAASEPVLVAHMDPEFTGPLAGRGFVVPDAWPEND